MKKIEVVTRPEKLVGLKEVLASHNCMGMTVYSVMGCGRQKGYLPEMNFTGDDINLLPKIMAFVVVEDDMVEDILVDVAAAVGTAMPKHIAIVVRRQRNDLTNLFICKNPFKISRLQALQAAWGAVRPYFRRRTGRYLLPCDRRHRI